MCLIRFVDTNNLVYLVTHCMSAATTRQYTENIMCMKKNVWVKVSSGWKSTNFFFLHSGNFYNSPNSFSSLKLPCCFFSRFESFFILPFIIPSHYVIFWWLFSKCQDFDTFVKSLEKNENSSFKNGKKGKFPLQVFAGCVYNNRACKAVPELLS